MSLIAECYVFDRRVRFSPLLCAMSSIAMCGNLAMCNVLGRFVRSCSLCAIFSIAMCHDLDRYDRSCSLGAILFAICGLARCLRVSPLLSVMISIAMIDLVRCVRCPRSL